MTPERDERHYVECEHCGRETYAIEMKQIDEHEDALCRLRAVERHAAAMERLIIDLLDVWQPEWGKGSLHDRAAALVGPVAKNEA